VGGGSWGGVSESKQGVIPYHGFARAPHTPTTHRHTKPRTHPTQANAAALEWALSRGCLPQLLGVQLLRLRWAADRLAAKLAAGAGEGGGGGAGDGDLLALLQARQQLRGRARQPEMVTL